MRLRLWGPRASWRRLSGARRRRRPPGKSIGFSLRRIREKDQGSASRRGPGFLRRAFLDLIGRIPTEAEIQKFLALPAKERRPPSSMS